MPHTSFKKAANFSGFFYTFLQVVIFGRWHVVSRGLFFGTVTSFVPNQRSLQPEGLLPSRGVAASGFPPLRNIPHCCLP